MKTWFLKHKRSIRNIGYTILCVIIFQTLGYSSDTSIIVAFIFYTGADLLIPMMEMLEELRDSGGTQ